MENILIYWDSVLKYTICILVSVLLARIYDGIKRREEIRYHILYYFIIATPFALLIGLRSANTGFDTENYIKWIENIKLVENREVIFRFILKFFESEFDKYGYSIIFIFFAYLTLVSYVWAVDLSGKNASVSLGLFIYLTYFGLRMGDQMRQLVAMSIFSLAYILLLKRKYILGTLVAGISVGTHTSALFAILLIVFIRIIKLYKVTSFKVYGNKFKSMLRLIICIVMGSIVILAGFQVIMVILSKIMISRYQFYFTSLVKYQKIGFGIIYELYPLILLGLFFREKLDSQVEHEIYAYAFLAIIFRLVGYYSYFVARMANYPILMGMILIGKEIKKYKGQNKFLVQLVIGISAILYFVLYYIILLGHGMVPYESIFD